MSQTSVSGISFLAVTIVVFGCLYLIDQSFNSRSAENNPPMREIKGSVGAVSSVEGGKPQARAPADEPDLAGNHRLPKKRGAGVIGTGPGSSS